VAYSRSDRRRRVARDVQHTGHLADLVSGCTSEHWPRAESSPPCSCGLNAIIGHMGSRRIVASFFILLVAVCAQFASARSPVPVLGSRHFAPHGIGWGTSKPPTLFNGGDPSGKIWNIRWGSWGGSVVAGRGLNWIFRPNGGYYAQPVPIELRAHLVGRCSPGQPLAYLKLDVREPSRPGGASGEWFAWGGAHLLCG
jgi:hypothetical protein